MGYQTEFYGEFTITDRATGEVGCRGRHAAYIDAFSDTRRMKRDPVKAEKQPDPARTKVGLPIGPEGAYYVGGGAEHGGDVLDYNRPPAGQPGLWCQWVVSPDGESLRWNEAEKFYDYVEWLRYLIDHFFTPWGYRLDGEVTWQGEDPGDIGKIVVVDSDVRVKVAKITFVDADEDGDS